MSSIIGVFLFVLASVCSGAALGGLSGLLLAAINNFILVPYFGAAEATYYWWVVFMAQMGSAGFGVLSMAWGSFLTYQKISGK